MFEHFHQQITDWFTSYAYEPVWIYVGLFATMFLSSFGFPFPEEIVIVSVGFVCYLARHPEIYPPPYNGAEGVNVWVAATTGFFSVFLSDLLIYFLGLRYGRRLLERPIFGKTFPPGILRRVERWMKKYGFWASGLFRFTPGLRCPGHMVCGMMEVPVTKFILVDGGAALISIPSQILLIGFYGEPVVQTLRHYKYVLFLVVMLVVTLFIFRWFLKHRKSLVPSSHDG